MSSAVRIAGPVAGIGFWFASENQAITIIVGLAIWVLIIAGCMALYRKVRVAA